MGEAWELHSPSFPPSFFNYLLIYYTYVSCLCACMCTSCMPGVLLRCPGTESQMVVSHQVRAGIRTRALNRLSCLRNSFSFIHAVQSLLPLPPSRSVHRAGVGLHLCSPGHTRPLFPLGWPLSHPHQPDQRLGTQKLREARLILVYGLRSVSVCPEGKGYSWQGYSHVGRKEAQERDTEGSQGKIQRQGHGS